MVSVKFKILPQAKLPLDFCKGNPLQRKKLAAKMNNDFIKSLSSYKTLNSDLLIQKFNDFLGENKININVIQESAPKTLASLIHSYSFLQNENSDLLTLCCGHIFRFLNPKNIDKKLLAHESRHFFDAITNPKTSIINGMEYYDRMKSWDICDAIHGEFFLPNSNMKNPKKAIETIRENFKNIPLEIKIEALKSYKKVLLSEQNAYHDERILNLKFAKGFKNKIQAFKEYVLLRKMETSSLQFKKKISVLNVIIKDTLKEFKSEHS